MTNMNDEILTAIQKSLPQATAGELKKYIEDAEKKAAELVKANEKITVLTKDNQKLENKVAELTSLMLEDSAVKAERVKLESDRNDFEWAKKLNAREVESEREKTQLAFQALQIVFKSQPTGYAFRNEINKSSYDPPSQLNNWQGTNKNSAETVSGTHKEITE